MTAATQVDASLVALLDQAAAAEGADVSAFDVVYRAAVAASAVSPELAAPHVAKLWFTPWRVPSGDHTQQREAAWTAGATQTTVDAGGTRLSALVRGDGPTALLVHGWGDHGARMGAFVEPLVRNGFRVVAPDMPGHGENPVRETNLYEWHAVVRALVREVDARVVVAHSIGGAAAVRTTADPSPVQALALLAPAVRLENAVLSWQRMLGLPDAVVPALRLAIARRFGGGVWEAWRGDQQPPAAGVRTLLVHSVDDVQVDAADARLLAGSRPRTEYVELDGLGHARLLRDPGVVERVVAHARTALRGDAAA